MHAIRAFRLASTVLALSGLLAACGSGSGSGSATATLSGTAATGAAIKGGTVALQCASGAAATATTGADGSWRIALTDQALPCALQVSGGDLPAGVVYHSVATTPGTVNLTPLTDWVVANLSGQAPASWFGDAGLRTALKAVAQADVDAALAVVTARLGLTSATLGERSPLTGEFKPDGVDALDKVLDAIKAALVKAGVTHADLVALARAGRDFAPPAALKTELLAQLSGGGAGTGGSGTDGGTATGPVAACKVSAQLAESMIAPTATELAAYAGTFDGEEGTLDEVSFVFTKQGDATLVVAADGSLTYKGVAYVPDSICVDKVAGPYGRLLYLMAGSGHFDVALQADAGIGQAWGVSPAAGNPVFQKGRKAGTGTGGGGAGLLAGLTLSKAIGGYASIGNALAEAVATTPAPGSVARTFKWNEGMAGGIQATLQHTTGSYLGSPTELLYLNLAYGPSPLLSTWIDGTSGGTCSLDVPVSLQSVYTPCSTLGIAFDKVAGTIRFTATPVIDKVGGNGTFTLGGGLNFKPF